MKLSINPHFGRRGAAIVEYAIIIGLVIVFSVVSIGAVGHFVNDDLTSVVFELNTGTQADEEGGSPGSPASGEEDPDSPAGDEDASNTPPAGNTEYDSCQNLYLAGERLDGVYDLVVRGTSFIAYCMMLTENDVQPSETALIGGWTLANWLLEDTNAKWGKGIPSDLSEGEYLQASRSISAAQLPDHESIAYGQGYKDGRMSVIGAFSSDEYDRILTLLGRSSAGHGWYVLYYDSLFDDETIRVTMSYNSYFSRCYSSITVENKDNQSGLSFDIYSQGRPLEWAFNYAPSPTSLRGACIGSLTRYSYNDSTAWAIWVR